MKIRLFTVLIIWALLLIITVIRLIDQDDKTALINVVIAWFGGVAFTFMVLDIRRLYGFDS